MEVSLSSKLPERSSKATRECFPPYVLACSFADISLVSIIAKTRHLLGGINAVDFGPFNGPYTGTVVTGNTIISESTFIKTGIAIGGMVWGSDNRTAGYTSLGTFNDNTFSSGPTGYFGYAMSVPFIQVLPRCSTDI